MNPPQISETSDKQLQAYVQYPYRWVIVILMSVSFVVNALANNAVIPIAQKLSQTYQLTDTQVNAPVFISFLIYSLMNFPANHLIDKFGLRFSLIVGNSLYTIGLLLFSLINQGYYLVFIGAVIIALGQPFVINCPAKIAATWFTQNNRALATGIMMGMNIIATGLGFVMPTIVVKQQSQGQQAKAQVGKLYWGYFLAGMIVCVAQILLMRTNPATPTSKRSNQQKIGVIQSFKKIKADRNLITFFSSYIILYGTFLTNGAISNQILKPYQYQDLQIALIGVATIISGVLGAVFYTYRIKVTKDYGGIIRKLLLIATIVMIIYTIWLNISAQIAVTVILALLLGFNFAPMVPITYDLGCQLAFPIGQVQVIGILNGGSMILTFFMTLLLSHLVGFGTKTQSFILFSIFVGLIIVGALLYTRVQIILKRSEYQNSRKNSKTAQIQMKQMDNINSPEQNSGPDGYEIMIQQK